MKEITFRLNDIPQRQRDAIKVIVDGELVGFVSCWADTCELAYAIACYPEDTLPPLDVFIRRNIPMIGNDS